MSNNSLLTRLPVEDRDHLMRRVKPVALASGESLHLAAKRMEFMYFPLDAVVSIQAQDGGIPVECASVGREGLVGLPALLADGSSPHAAVVQFGGRALRLRSSVVRAQFECSVSMRRILLRYAQDFTVQLAQNAICHRMHRLEARLARWLLHAHDARGSEVLEVTQERLAQLLGVQRSGVCLSIASLQDAGGLEHGRGFVRVRDRRVLEAASCSCYRLLEDERARLDGARFVERTQREPPLRRA